MRDLDPVEARPVVSGLHGRAWEVDVAVARRRCGVSEESDGTVGLWIIEAPWAHPVWHSYVLTLVHLLPMPDGRPTKFYLEGATHELWLEALDPDKPREPGIAGGVIYRLQPPNFAAQIDAADHTAARVRCTEAIVMICNGKLSPDTDYIRQWVALFGDNMLRDGT